MSRSTTTLKRLGHRHLPPRASRCGEPELRLRPLRDVYNNTIMAATSTVGAHPPTYNRWAVLDKKKLHHTRTGTPTPGSQNGDEET